MWIKNKYLSFIVIVIFITVISQYLYSLYFYVVQCHGYVVGDWLINFKDGFVRRGLGGYLILSISDLLSIKLNHTVMFIQVTFYLAYMFILLLLLFRKKINIWFIILFLSPAILFFPIYDEDVVGRKEIILFFIYGIFLLCLNNKKIKSNYVVYAFSIALMLATLFHELIFFYIPYFVLAAFIKSRIDKEPFNIYQSYSILLSSCLVMIPLYFLGKNIGGTVICADLLERGLSENICNGILSWPNDFGIKEVLKMAISFDYFWSYGVALVLSLLPFVLLIKYSNFELVTIKYFLIVFLVLFMFSLPLFILAVDWGRWLNIHFILLLFTATLFLKKESAESIGSWHNERVSLPLLWKAESKLSILTSNISFLFLCAVYLTFFKMLHWGEFSVFSINRIIALYKYLLNLLP